MKASFIGLGYIGLPTAIIAAKHGHEIVGVDINPLVVEKTNKGNLHFIEPGLESYLQDVLSSGLFKASDKPEPSDAFFIVVPTPFKGNHEPDISHVESAARAILPYLQKGNLLVIESTSPVGTTEKIADLIFNERHELKNNIYIAYCPERVLPGNIIYELEHNDRVIGGLTPKSTIKAMEFYNTFVKGTLHGANARTAEMCKLVENASRDVQIAFANELSIICDRAEINVRELIALANKHPRVNILNPGCGVGGHCIAVDPYFLTSAFPLESRMITIAREINNYKAFWCVEQINEIIRDYFQKTNQNPTVALMGLAFKANIDDLRESPAIYIANRVMDNKKAHFLVCEPNIERSDNFTLASVEEISHNADIVVFLVAHNEFKNFVKKDNQIILDFCGL